MRTDRQLCRWYVCSSQNSQLSYYFCITAYSYLLTLLIYTPWNCMASSKLRSGLPLDRQTKEVISNVHDFCTIEKDNIIRTCEPCGTYCLVHPTKVIQRVAQLTGVSERTVSRIVQEKKQGQSGAITQEDCKTATSSGALNAIDDLWLSAETVQCLVSIVGFARDRKLGINKWFSGSRST